MKGIDWFFMKKQWSKKSDDNVHGVDGWIVDGLMNKMMDGRKHDA